MVLYPKTRKEYDGLCNETLAYFKRRVELHPENLVYKSICDQISMIQKELSQGVRYDKWKDMQRYSLGAMSARYDDRDVYGAAIGIIQLYSFIYFDMPEDELRTPDEMLAFINKTIALMEQPFYEYQLKREYDTDREKVRPYIEEDQRVLRYIKAYLEGRNDGSQLDKMDLEECKRKSYLDFNDVTSFSMYEVIPNVIEHLKQMHKNRDQG